jgi:hypothetical protein
MKAIGGEQAREGGGGGAINPCRCSGARGCVGCQALPGLSGVSQLSTFFERDLRQLYYFSYAVD